MGGWVSPAFHSGAGCRLGYGSHHRASGPSILVKEGLLQRTPRRGTFVRQREEKLTCVAVYDWAVNMTPKANNGTEVLVETFSQFAAAATPPPKWLPPVRKAGIAGFAELGFPTLADGRGALADVAPNSTNSPSRWRAKPSVNGAETKALRGRRLYRLPGNRLVFVNGFFSAKLSSLKPVAHGVRIESLAAALARDSALIEKHLGKYAHTANNAFTALNQAFFTDGAFIFVPPGVAVAEPMQLFTFPPQSKTAQRSCRAISSSPRRTAG